MTDTNATAVVDGPKVVRIREKGKKGPGEKIGIFTNQTEANKVAEVLKTDKVEAIFSDYVAETAVTYDQWKANANAEAQNAAALQSVLSKLSPEDQKIVLANKKALIAAMKK